MRFILKENEWAKQMIATHDIGEKPSETLRCAARYYIDSGYSREDTRRKLDEFILRCDSDASLVLWSKSLDQALKRAAKRPAVDIDEITISKTELEKINSLEGKPIKRLAFTLLCLSKYYMAINPKCDNWVSLDYTKIMNLANIKTSQRRRYTMLHTLYEIGMIRLAREVDNTSVQVCFGDNNEREMGITDFSDLGYQYLMYCGEPYFECEECGRITKYSNPKNKRNQHYCTACSEIMDKKHRRDANKRYREKLTNSL